MQKQNKLNKEQLNSFKTTIWDYFHAFGRSFAWRETTNPYHVVVSEIMLQQTQTYRVDDKYQIFIEKFPNFSVLAQAPLRDVLTVWQGLGYNRRALFLHKLAQKVITEYDGILPDNPELLINLPGIGKATAASICAFAFNQPTIFIETNIRAVFIHFFFLNQEKVHDNEIFPLIEQTIEQKNARQWYYALMDYGVMLKKKFPNPSRKSKHHLKQSKFEGSDRQIRGMILKILTVQPVITYQELNDMIQDDRMQFILQDLCREELIKKKANLFSIY
ncbi:MAG: hypothetical protein WDZ41_00335 [Candidatus Babeliales bacterium]